jgi:hypothetical protein
MTILDPHDCGVVAALTVLVYPAVSAICCCASA